jgi:hypothetical protein
MLMEALVILYAIGAAATMTYNLRGLIVIINPLAIIRNALLWPIFLPVLIATR